MESKSSKSAKAGLLFPVGRIHRFLKTRKFADRITIDASVYMASVLGYLATEMVELSGNAAITLAKKRIEPRHIQLAVEKDKNELEKLFENATIPNSGGSNSVTPTIHAILFPSDSEEDDED